MSSWVICRCGNQLHKNLFAGANVCVVVEDVVLDEIDDETRVANAINTIIQHGDILVRCEKCGRLAIEDKQTGAVTIYTQESS
jgi:hypothetical protein